MTLQPNTPFFSISTKFRADQALEYEREQSTRDKKLTRPKNVRVPKNVRFTKNVCVTKNFYDTSSKELPYQFEVNC